MRRLEIKPFGLYLILTGPAAGYERGTEAAVSRGVRFLQLRMKDAPREHVLGKAKALREITRGTRTLFIVNDDIGIAMDVDADGVHLGQEDMTVAEARRLWSAPGKLFGLSVHNEAEARAAGKADYVGVGPVFPTPVKAGPDPAMGLEKMQRIIRAAPCPAVAIGGINADNLRDVLAHGAENFAVVRAVNESMRPEEEIERLMEIWRKAVGFRP